jgi:hypothetical protein
LFETVLQDNRERTHQKTEMHITIMREKLIQHITHEARKKREITLKKRGEKKESFGQITVVVVEKEKKREYSTELMRDGGLYKYPITPRKKEQKKKETIDTL